MTRLHFFQELTLQSEEGAAGGWAGRGVCVWEEGGGARAEKMAHSIYIPHGSMLVLAAETMQRMRECAQTPWLSPSLTLQGSRCGSDTHHKWADGAHRGSEHTRLWWPVGQSP